MDRRWWAKPRGGAGWLAVAGITAGIVTWWPIALGVGGTWFVLAMRDIRRSARAMIELAAAFPEAKRRGAPSPRWIAGQIGDMPFEIRDGVDTLTVLIGTPVPHGIRIERARSQCPVGDPRFDAMLAVSAEDPTSELAWRLMLSVGLRARCTRLFAIAPTALRDGWIEIVIDDGVVDGATIEAIVREGNALGNALWERLAVDDPLAVLAERIPHDPDAGVRIHHYAWLVAIGYEVPALLKLAAQDPHEDIRAWAAAQRPEASEYR